MIDKLHDGLAAPFCIFSILNLANCISPAINQRAPPRQFDHRLQRNHCRSTQKATRTSPICPSATLSNATAKAKGQWTTAKAPTVQIAHRVSKELYLTMTARPRRMILLARHHHRLSAKERKKNVAPLTCILFNTTMGKTL